MRSGLELYDLFIFFLLKKFSLFSLFFISYFCYKIFRYSDNMIRLSTSSGVIYSDVGQPEAVVLMS